MKILDDPVLVRISLVGVSKLDHFLRLLQDLFNLWVVNFFDLIVIQEVLLCTCMFDNLEAGLVQCILIFSSPDVVDSNLLREWFSIVGFRSVCV